MSHVLKAADARDLGSRVAFNFEDLRHQAAAHLAAAKVEAAAIVEQARRDADALRSKVHTEARDAGRQEGLKDAAALVEQRARKLADERLGEQLNTTLPALTQAATLLRGERDRWLARWEQSAIELGIAVAEKLVRADLTARPQRAHGMIAEALELAIGQPQLRVFLNPQDRACLGDRAEQVVQSLTACATPQLIEDPALLPGDCRIETQHGEVDARLETMLQRIAEELLGS
jgi:flagellar assembly protein FliH